MIIGDRGTDSLALHDPHAFLFSRENNLLVIPVTLYEDPDDENVVFRYGGYTWEGAYVLHVSEDGFDYEGRITHQPVTHTQNDGYYMNEYQVKRSFYIGDVLFTISDTLLKANDMDNLDELETVKLE
jgi:hypothetical protein